MRDLRRKDPAQEAGGQTPGAVLLEMQREVGKRKTALRRILGVTLLIAVLDQLSKLAILDRIGFSGQEIKILPNCFSLILLSNKGTAFGLFARQNTLFIVISLVIIVGLLFYAYRFFNYGIFFQISAGLILGGAIGNLIDRIWRGGVVDFLDCYLRFGGKLHHWPAFNLADSAICVGVTLLIFLTFRQRKKED